MTTQKTNALLSTIEVNPSSPATFVIIWMHGLGANAEDFVPVAKELQALTGLALRFVFPNAPMRPVTVNNGFIMPAWYDIVSFEKSGEFDHDGIANSVQQINLLIEKERAQGFAANKIMVAGFSQGAVIALSTLLSYPEPLGGAIALSGYLALPEEKNIHQHQAPVFLGHGLLDDVVPYFLGQHAYDFLKKANYPVTWRTYPMPHSVCEEEIRDIANWLQKIG